MLTNQPHPLISLLVITAAVLITYPLATRLTDALRPLMEDFLDRRDARRYGVTTVTPVADRVDGRLDEARLKLNDQQRADAGLLDPDEPTETAHREWLAATYGPIKADEFTPAQRAAIRTEFKSSGVEHDGHLTVTPPNGTEVILIANDDYLRRSMGVVVGQRGTVLMPTNLNPEDKGVLVDWGVRPNDGVRMSLHEIRLAPDA